MNYVFISKLAGFVNNNMAYCVRTVMIPLVFEAGGRAAKVLNMNVVYEIDCLD